MIDFYCEKNGVLKNKLGITDYEEFKKAENYFFNLRLNELMQVKYFSMEPDYVCNLHYKLFNDMYSWAGEYRLINLERSEPALGGYIMQFDNFEIVDFKIVKLFYGIKRVKLSDLDIDEKLNYLTLIITRLWKIHPFRDCNTRTLIAFIDQYCKSSGLTFKTYLLKEKLDYFRRSLVAATFEDEFLGVKPNYTYLHKIMKDGFEDNYKKGRQKIKA